MKSRVALYLLLINLFFALLLSSLAFFPTPVLRIILGLPVLFFFPGYVVLITFFPDNQRLNNWERTALSFGLSIALVAIIGMLLSYTPWGISLHSALLSLWGVILVLSLIALYRQRRLPAEPSSSFYSAWRLPSASTFAKPVVLWLILILVLGYGLTFIPHSDYPYPLHVDEWMHLAYSRAIQEAGSLNVATVPIYEFPDFATGKLMTRPGDVEPAFHVFWAIGQQVTTISWLTIFRYFPGLIFLLTIFAVYVLAMRNGYGLEAAFFTALITTNTTMLGVSLLVPVALGLLFLPLALMLVFYHRTPAAYVILAVFIGFLALMHLPTAVILAMILLLFAIFQARKEKGHSLAIVVATLVPLLAISPLISQVAPELVRSFTQLTYLPAYLPYLPSPLYLWGFLASLFFVAGIFWLVKKGEAADYALIVACLLLLLHNLVFFYWHWGVQIIYHRSPHHLMLMMSIIAGYALWRLRNLSLPYNLAAQFKLSSVWYWLRPVLAAVLIGLVLVESASFHLETPFYRMIDEADYTAFVWIEQNVPDSYQKAVLDPWSATAFMALARREVYARIQHEAQHEEHFRAYEFLENGCRDTDFLRENGISIVYSLDEVFNPDLIQVRENIYLLPETGTNP